MDENPLTKASKGNRGRKRGKGSKEKEAEDRKELGQASFPDSYEEWSRVNLPFGGSLVPPTCASEHKRSPPSAHYITPTRAEPYRPADYGAFPAPATRRPESGPETEIYYASEEVEYCGGKAPSSPISFSERPILNNMILSHSDGKKSKRRGNFFEKEIKRLKISRRRTSSKGIKKADRFWRKVDLLLTLSSPSDIKSFGRLMLEEESANATEVSSSKHMDAYQAASRLCTLAKIMRQSEMTKIGLEELVV